ncbi:hypothetical protein IA539_07865 [Gordonia sp. zg691]|uniref:hypothetical protein n=1 Tax=Gordonia jinghuaiqii TaxID=2758710 RepID=UPI0016622667|nr:hypothetical protein [Gordonia jinghuaiqii]MBD0861130.1 hypothetical protein [Gordonia jinghuaiqii]
MFAAPDVADLWSATISRLLIVAAALTLSLTLLFVGKRAREWSAVIAVTPCVSGAVLLLVEV